MASSAFLKAWSPSSTWSKVERFTSPISCAMWAIRIAGGQVSWPASSCNWPSNNLNKVVLPAPLRPTKPYLWPESRVKSAPSIRGWPPRCSVILSNLIMAAHDTTGLARHKPKNRQSNVNNWKYFCFGLESYISYATRWMITFSIITQVSQRYHKGILWKL